MAGRTRADDLGPLGTAGTGTIGPAGPDDGTCQRQLIDAETAELALRPLAPNALIAGELAFVTADCVDGRPLASEFPDPRAPRTAGGTLGLLTGLWALDDRFAEVDAVTLAHGCAAHRLPVWAHAGCGANERLTAVADYLVARRGDLDAVRHRLGLTPVPPSRTVQSARLVTRVAATSPASRIAGFTQAGLGLARFEGDHAESAVIVNLVRGWSVDRAAIARTAGGTQAFVLDAWALRDSAAAALSAAGGDPRQRDDLADIMMDINLATLAVLGNQRLRLIVLTSQ